MSWRSMRVLAPVAVAALVAFVVVVVSAGSPPSAIASIRADRARLVRCGKAVLGAGRGPAKPLSGSAGPQVVSHLAVFRRARSTADALPRVAKLGEALAGAGATSYDPSAAVRLTLNGANRAIYAVPATMALSTLPTGCNGLPQLAGVGAYLAMQAEDTGSGPGACLISTELEQSAPSGLPLPGAAAPKPAKTLAIAQTVCSSEGVLLGYVGALGHPLQGSGTRRALIPDGVSAITYTLADGYGFTVPVAGNLAAPPAELSIQTSPRRPTATELRKQLAAHLPTTVTESGAGASPTTTLTRPASLIPDAVGGLSFLRRLVLSSSSAGTSSSGSTGASCSARTHRCVAVTVTTTCDRHEHCRTSRSIHRYRYVGRRPPAGTTGPDTQPTAPIVAHTNRLVTRPTKLTLVLSGTPHRRVVVLMSVSCFSRSLAAGSGGPPLQVPVPSRTPIALPGAARSFHACDVGALVTSTERGLVHVTVARG